MTVAIGLVCQDGVLVASDSMASDPPTAHKVTKVFSLAHCPVVWTASGSVYVIEEVQRALAGIDQLSTSGGPPAVFAKPIQDSLRDKLKSTIHRAMRSSYESALASTPFAQGAIAPGFETDFVVCGYANSTPWLLEFARDGQVNWHTPLGFYATGSGGPFATVARALMAHYLTARVSIDQAKMIAYRAVQTTCEVSQSGVGPPVQIAVVDADGARTLSEDEVEAVGAQVERWKTLEVETLLMSPEAAKENAQGDLPSIETDGADQL